MFFTILIYITPNNDLVLIWQPMWDRFIFVINFVFQSFTSVWLCLIRYAVNIEVSEVVHICSQFFYADSWFFSHASTRRLQENAKICFRPEKTTQFAFPDFNCLAKIFRIRMKCGIVDFTRNSFTIFGVICDWPRPDEAISWGVHRKWTMCISKGRGSLHISLFGCRSLSELALQTVCRFTYIL